MLIIFSLSCAPLDYFPIVKKGKKGKKGGKAGKMFFLEIIYLNII